jgi:RecA-family ATPase
VTAEGGASFLLAEQAVLGALLIDASAVKRVNGIGPDHFADARNRAIFLAIRDCYEADGIIDLLAVDARLENLGGDDGMRTYLATLAQHAPAPANVHRYAELVQEKAQRRALTDLGVEIQERAARCDLAELGRDVRDRLDGIGAKSSRGLPAALDLSALAEREPVAPRHIVEPWIPAGEVTLLAGHGGAGKSAVALHLAVCIALGAPWHGLSTERRRVLYVSAEDPAPVLHWRLARICAYLGVELGDVRGLDVLDVSGTEAELMVDTPDGPILTASYETLRERMAEADVLVLDGASDLYGGSEIVRRHVRRFIRALRRLASPDGAVLLLAHIDKAIARGKETGDHYSGSTAWNNSVRARWALRPDGDGLVLALEKANHAQAGAEIRLRWDAAAHMHLPISSPTDGGMVGAIRERQERDGILAAMRACAETGIIVPAALQGERNAYNVLAARPELPESLRSGRDARARFRAHLEALRQIRAFTEQSIRRSNRHYTLALVLTDIGTAPDAPDYGN